METRFVSEPKPAPGAVTSFATTSCAPFAWSLRSASARSSSLPAASVSGYYIGHPDARFFGLGKIGRDQVADYAARKGVSQEQAEIWLAPNLAYTPGTD